MTFDDYLNEHRLSLFGMYVMQCRGVSTDAIQPPYPPAELEAEELEALIDDLELCMPTDNVIVDLRDWDLRLYDLMSDDWFFGAAFGPQALTDSYASDLADAFVQEAGSHAMDYDQGAAPEAFASLVGEEAQRFITAWRLRILQSRGLLESAA